MKPSLPLPVVAEAVFERDAPPYAWVTFLNRALKRHGFTFGVSDEEDGFRLIVYATGAWRQGGNDGRTKGEGG